MNILLTDNSCMHKIPPAPNERFLFLMGEKQIRNEPRMPSVAVRKRMDLRKPVVKPDRGSSAIFTTCQPRLRILTEISYGHRYLGRINADASFIMPILTGPAPGIAEHPLV